MACILKCQIHSSSWWTWITLAGFTLHVVPPTVMAPIHLEINATVHDPCHCIWQQQFSPCLGTWNQSLEEWWYINISLGLSLLGLPRLSGIWLLLFPLRINPGSHCGRPPAIRIYRQRMSSTLSYVASMPHLLSSMTTTRFYIYTLAPNDSQSLACRDPDSGASEMDFDTFMHALQHWNRCEMPAAVTDPTFSITPSAKTSERDFLLGIWYQTNRGRYSWVT